MRIKTIISTLTLLLVLSFSAQANGDESKKYAKLRNAVIEKVQEVKTGISDYMSAKVHIHFTVNEKGELIIKEVKSKNKMLAKSIKRGLHNIQLEDIDTDKKDFWLTIDYKVM